MAGIRDQDNLISCFGKMLQSSFEISWVQLLKYTIDNKGLVYAEMEIVKKGLNSPTFIDIILNGKSSDELSSWFMDVSSENLGEYIKFVIFACLVVDCFSKDGDSASDTTEALGSLYNIQKPVTLLGLPDIAKLVKRVNPAEISKEKVHKQRRITNTRRRRVEEPEMS